MSTTTTENWWPVVHRDGTPSSHTVSRRESTVAFVSKLKAIVDTRYAQEDICTPQESKIQGKGGQMCTINTSQLQACNLETGRLSTPATTLTSLQSVQSHHNTVDKVKAPLAEVMLYTRVCPSSSSAPQMPASEYAATPELVSSSKTLDPGALFSKM